MNKPTLYMTKGLPGSGKTTWAQGLVNGPGGKTSIVCKDDLRLMMHNGKHSKGNEKLILGARNAMCHTLLAMGSDVIVADTNFAPFHEETLRAVAESANANFVVQDFTHVPLATCIRNDASRSKPVGTKVIRGMFDKYIKPPPPVHDPTLPHCIIVDMDGTLANHTGLRTPFEDQLAHLDTPHEDVIKLMMTYITAQDEVHLIIMSGRDEGRSRLVTGQWIEKHLGEHPDLLLMRPAGDVRKDSIVKRELYEKHIAGRYNVDFVVDDRNQVVDMWRDELGLRCLQVADGNF